jgi:hypothetical protein
MKHFAYLTILFVISSCVENTNKNSNSQKESELRNDSFNKIEYVKQLVKKVGLIELPYSFDILNDQIDSEYVIKSNSADTLFFEIGNVHISGILPDTLNFYCFLYITIGDLAYPKLLTIDKKGIIIDRKSLCLGVCGAPIDVDSSINRITIDKELKIKSYYYCKGTVETNDSIPKNIEINERIEGVGIISKNGKIEFETKEY